MTPAPPHTDAHAMTDRSRSPPPATLPISGFDVVARAWMVEHGVDARRAPLPLLLGKLVVDVASQVRAVDGDGHPARQLIAAMLLPGGVEDIVRMMRFCDEHGIVVTSPNAPGDADPGPIVRIHADALGRQRPMLRVVRTD